VPLKALIMPGTDPKVASLGLSPLLLGDAASQEFLEQLHFY